MSRRARWPLGPGSTALTSLGIGTVFGLLAVALLILANGFFVALEFGLVAVDRSRVETAAEGGDATAGVVRRLLSHLSFHLSGAQLGITMSSLLLGFLARGTIASLFEPILGGVVPDAAIEGLAVVLAIAFATALQMVVGELVPKTVAIDKPFETSMRLARLGRVWGIVARPIISSFDAAANWTVRRLGIEPAEEIEQTRSLDEIGRLIESSGEGGTLDVENVELLRRSIRLGEKTAADALIPRMEIVSLNPTDSASDLARVATTSGRSRFPVFGEDADDIVGIVHLKVIYGIDPDRRSGTLVADLMVDPLFVPETTDLDILLLQMRETRHQLVIVVDEHGGTAGILTVEDILEEIVGEIEDEYDRDEPALTRIEEPGTTLVSGSLHHDEVADACGFEMPEGDYETLAGFVLSKLGRIPVPGDRFLHEGWRVEVVAMDRRRIASVRLVAPARSTTGEST